MNSLYSPVDFIEITKARGSASPGYPTNLQLFLALEASPPRGGGVEKGLGCGTPQLTSDYLQSRGVRDDHVVRAAPITPIVPDSIWQIECQPFSLSNEQLKIAHTGSGTTFVIEYSSE